MRSKVEGKVFVRQLTNEDIPMIDADHLNGRHMVYAGYYLVWLDSDPSKYVYMRTFGGLDPEEPGFDLTPYAYIDHCGFLGDFLQIDLAEIRNNEYNNPPKEIFVEFLEDVPGINAKIFVCPETKAHYMRLSSYPNEQFARWMSAYRQFGHWEEDGSIRANITFVMGEARELVRCSNWNGDAVYKDQFDIRFEMCNT